MDYSEIIYLISQVKEEDEIGNILPSSETLNKCYAKKQSVKLMSSIMQQWQECLHHVNLS